MKAANRRKRMDRSILERLAFGDGVKKICKQLQVCNKRVREVRRKGIEAGYLSEDGRSPGKVQVPAMPASIFEEFVDKRTQKESPNDEILNSVRDRIVKQLDDEGWSPITVFEELPFPPGTVKRSSFYRYLKRNGLKKGPGKPEDGLIGPIVHKPGEALILDWGKLRDVIDPKTGKKRTLWALVGVMGFSRYMMVRLVWSNSVAQTQNMIEHFLQELGGVPSRITSDNPKCFALKADKYDPFLNPAIERFAAHYGFRMECLPPRDPKKKGKVERMMPYARRLFEAYPKQFVSIEHAQEYINKKCEAANHRKHGTTRLKPIEQFIMHEAKALKDLPALSYELETVAYPKVRKDGFVRFENKYYAVSDCFIGKQATVLGTAHRISIFIDGKLAETYNRVTDPQETHAIQEHLKKDWQKMTENQEYYMTRAELIGPECACLIKEILSRNDGFVDLRLVWGILSLNKKYRGEAIDQACSVARRSSKLSSRYVESLLSGDLSARIVSESPDKQEITPVINNVSDDESTSFKFIRPMSVYLDSVYEQAQAFLKAASL